MQYGYGAAPVHGGPAGTVLRGPLAADHAAMPPLILASTSRYRRALLERLGLPFTQQAPDCDEDALKAAGLSPEALAVELAARKAGSIATGRPDSVVIGSDQLVALDDAVLGKPGSVEAAVAQLERMCGREHLLLTAVCVRQGGRCWQHCDQTTLRMRSLDQATLRRYVERDQPLDCAGAYKLEAGGIALFERIDSADHSAITGLPLIWLSGLLRQLGYQLP
jgi:septum formation protein